MSETKYDAFFSSVRTFLLTHQVSQESDFQGLSEEEIARLEILCNVPFDLCFRTYLTYFGAKMHIIGSPLSMSGFTGPVMEKVMYERDEFTKVGVSITKQISNTTVLDSSFEGPLEKPLTSVVLLDFEEHDRSFTFLEGGVENPRVYTFLAHSDSIVSLNTRFTDHLRWGILNDFVFMWKANQWGEAGHNSKGASILELSWGAYYKTLKDNSSFWYNYVTYRIEFQSITRDLEDAENRLLDFNEWEDLFVLFLQEIQDKGEF